MEVARLTRGNAWRYALRVVYSLSDESGPRIVSEAPNGVTEFTLLHAFTQWASKLDVDTVLGAPQLNDEPSISLSSKEFQQQHPQAYNALGNFCVNYMEKKHE